MRKSLKVSDGKFKFKCQKNKWKLILYFDYTEEKKEGHVKETLKGKEEMKAANNKTLTKRAKADGGCVCADSLQC